MMNDRRDMGSVRRDLECTVIHLGEEDVLAYSGKLCSKKKFHYF